MALGHKAEQLAADHLVALGMQILERNFRVGRLELDIVAREGVVIVVVEVRTRSQGAWIKALDSVDWRKCKRVRAAGEALWRRRFQQDPTVERMRFDVLSVTLSGDAPPAFEHVKAAF